MHGTWPLEHQCAAQRAVPAVAAGEEDRFSWTLCVYTCDNDPRDRGYSKYVAIDPVAREYCVLRKGLMLSFTPGVKTRIAGDYPIRTFSDEEWRVLEEIVATENALPIQVTQGRARTASDVGYPEFALLSPEQQRALAFANHFGGVYWWADDGDDRALDTASPAVFPMAWMQDSYAQLMNNKRIAYASLEFTR